MFFTVLTRDQVGPFGISQQKDQWGKDCLVFSPSELKLPLKMSPNKKVFLFKLRHFEGKQKSRICCGSFTQFSLDKFRGEASSENKKKKTPINKSRDPPQSKIGTHFNFGQCHCLGKWCKKGCLFLMQIVYRFCMLILTSRKIPPNTGITKQYEWMDLYMLWFGEAEIRIISKHLTKGKSRCDMKWESGLCFLFCVSLGEQMWGRHTDFLYRWRFYELGGVSWRTELINVTYLSFHSTVSTASQKDQLHTQ